MLKGFQQFTGFNDRYRLTVKLDSLAGLFCKVVNDHRFCGHFDDVGWMRAVQLRTQQLRKVVLLIFNFLKGWTISSPQWGAGR
jgi:hypothetical protein